MSDIENGTENNTGGKAEFTPPATQEELNSLIAGRLERERAKYADHEELKAKAAKLAEIEAANLTELEKANAAAEAARAEVEAVKAKLADRDAKDARAALVAEVSKATGVPAELLHGETKEELEAHAVVLAKYAGRKVDVVPTAGSGGEATSGGGMAAGRERARKK
ncbi:sRNA-binding protein [Mycetocola sp. BIGb0189]|uniref:hypothetical protein n=1 Tax=Mycetocola sp. BIGb0189 TaxID=2940604 RepID=UPI0021696139|nr:hypothetical protein [Mycetocola sp. BIGb0189]MCS4278027.1 sRNA-binding protein [Mycetocola sp. BIGb0189]